jgi:BirA family transcriptional regulator, biotin operon repressor / biotin---[acetyl-CoA-carboxylase] ligase
VPEPTPRETWDLDARHVGRRVLVFDALPSTNDLAASLASDLANAGTVVLADYQTAGRGQYGRTWQSRPGASLLLSALVFPPAGLRRPVVMTAWAAVAVAETVLALTGMQARIKWPNDVLVRGKKVCGILIEQGVVAGPEPRFRTVAGVGLNLGQTADEFAALGLPDAASLGMLTGSPVGLRAAVGAVVRNLDAEWARLLAGERAAVEADWKWRVGFLGRDVEVERADGSRPTGRLRDMGFDGVELERPDGSVEVIPPEAVEHVRGAESR